MKKAFSTLVISLSVLCGNVTALAEDERPLAAAIEKGDLEEFKKLTAEERRSVEKTDGPDIRRVDGIEETDIVRMIGLTQQWEMLEHLFSLGIPQDISGLGEIAVKFPKGDRVVETLITSYPGFKDSKIGTEFLCDLIHRLDISGVKEPHPLVSRLVEGGVPLEAEPHSALISAVENRDPVLIKYLLENGAEKYSKADWKLRCFADLIIDIEFDAELLCVLSRSPGAMKALESKRLPKAQQIIRDFETEYPPLPDSKLVGTYALIDNSGIVPLNRFRLLPDRTALLDQAGLFNAAAWTVEGERITLLPIGPEGPKDESKSILVMTDEPGVVVIVQLHGEPVERVKARLLGGASAKEFVVPKDSAAIGSWQGEVDDESATIEISLNLLSDASGTMKVVSGDRSLGAFDIVWEHDTDADQIVAFTVVAGEVQYDQVAKFKLAPDGKSMTAVGEGAVLKRIGEK